MSNSEGSPVIAALSGLGVGMMLSNLLNKNKETSNTEVTSVATVYELQSKVNEALLNSIKYEQVIKDLNEKLKLPTHNQTTIDFLQLQLEDVTKLYDGLMTYARSKIPDLPTSFEVVETPVEGLHFAPHILFKRTTKDRNVVIDNGVIKILGVDNYPVSVYSREAGMVTELKSRANPLLPNKLINIDTSVAGSQIYFGNNNRTWIDSDAGLTQMAEPLLLIEFDPSVNLAGILSNIKIGAITREGTNTARNINGYVSLYRANILAVKLLGIADANTTWSTMTVHGLQLSTWVATQQLMILSTTVVDSKQVHVSQHNPGSNSPRASNYLMGKYVPFTN